MSLNGVDIAFRLSTYSTSSLLAAANCKHHLKFLLRKSYVKQLRFCLPVLCTRPVF